MERRGKLSVYDKPLQKTRNEVSLSAFAFLFAEVVEYCLKKASVMHDLEEHLHELGRPAGVRVLDLYVFRDNRNRRETRLLPMLTFIATSMWKQLFGHAAELLKGQDHENEYMLNDKALLVNRFISVPRDLGDVNCGAFVAGMVEGILCSAEFPATASAHTVEEATGGTSTTILIRFEEAVLAREKRFNV
mmetsp:Transcript_21145/g.39749  ORF Transcript_21145/g.39749 Transcript_21145/m.39749 type:complete len:190 (+) Transcript_21145:99-668(+)